MKQLAPIDTEARAPKPRRWLTRVKPIRVVQRAALSLVHRHPHRNLLIVGQPKSGTTWLRRMVCEIPGYIKWTPPCTEWYNDHVLEYDNFEPPPIGYTVSRVHSGPDAQSLDVVRRLDRPYVIMTRDHRDVAVSWAYYMEHAHHGMTPEVKAKELGERIDLFIDEYLLEYVRWTDGWARGRDPRRGLIVWYEDLVADPHAAFATIARHYEVNLSDEQIGKIVDKHSFRKATGREAGTQDAKAFNRKGIAGDWRNHFTDAQLATFNEVIRNAGLTDEIAAKYLDPEPAGA